MSDLETAFVISQSERRAANEWMLVHKCAHRDKYRSITWMFTTTGIGTVVELKCSCGAQVDVSDYGSW